MSVVERPMSFPKTLSGDKTASVLATVAIGMAIVWCIYMLRPEMGGLTITIVASMIAFLIGRSFAFFHNSASGPPRHGRTAKGLRQAASVAVRKRPTWLAPIPLRELANGNFRVEDWQNGEYA
jgi:hypothetical protein